MGVIDTRCGFIFLGKAISTFKDLQSPALSNGSSMSIGLRTSSDAHAAFATIIQKRLHLKIFLHIFLGSRFPKPTKSPLQGRVGMSLGMHGYPKIMRKIHAAFAQKHRWQFCKQAIWTCSLLSIIPYRDPWLTNGAFVETCGH